MKIYVAKHHPDAQIVFELLKQQQIHCEIRGGSLTGLQGELPFSDDLLPYVWLLNPYQEKQAQRIVGTFLKETENSSYPDWTCPHCHTLVEGQFAQCWHCEEYAPSLE